MAKSDVPRPKAARCRQAVAGALSIALAASLAAPMLSLTGCSSSENPGTTASAPEPEPVYVSPYDWESNLSVEGDRYSYSEDGEQKSLLGIDVSDHQNSINWAAVKADGVEFAILRIGYRGSTEGDLYEDSRFADNVLGAQAAGMPIGVYFFSQATTEDEAREEAQFVLDKLSEQGLSPENLAYPVVFDQEPAEGDGRANGLSAEQYTKNALAFCQAVEEAGYRPMVYGNQTDMAARDIDQLESYPVWYAEYGPSVPSANFDFTMWQYTNEGAVRGIDVPVDLNIYMVDERKGTWEVPAS